MKLNSKRLLSFFLSLTTLSCYNIALGDISAEEKILPEVIITEGKITDSLNEVMHSCLYLVQ